MRVLIVDDSKLVRYFVREVLDKHQFQYAEATDGKEGLNKLKKESFDLVLLDWNMPNLDGAEFLKALESTEYSSPPVLMMTTENSVEKMAEALSLGAKDYMMKPFTEEILLAKISENLDSKKVA